MLGLVEVWAYECNVTGGRFGGVVLVARIVDIFINLGDFLLCNSSSHYAGPYNAFFFWHCWAHSRNFLRDFSQPHRGMLLFMRPRCLSTGPGGHLHQLWLEAMVGSLKDAHQFFFVLLNFEALVDLETTP